ncbi:helix-turn-helix transcriptional regulator [Lactiplantibacillus plantarum]|uniref:helix-turn-helix transcriptional regulator n=1 Tax=Lactiplantibacillus plantarum TaxID=1590 RepID=UPI00067E6653|nr:helix-turn-helix transcriptional regulator [Lactiplantibacillus plantarum]ASL37136.1 transcriptional regulator [Lactiplantibacillus plantarum]ASZ31944.1 XRE family transcriptional regulator [Lactiplantibacillus plantarum]KON38662.1 hypothetical protein ADS73_13930 [Lactiplantibacillus plantarum]MBS0936834.1 helix-turn-helix transcriptional regulator [Lactiplantibacillus plantarum]MBS0944148.1 helix-turn-helix transcriptional regulator [Lactiplantibacillus plantarum]
MLNNVKALRQEKQMSQATLADMAKVSRPYLSDVENGKVVPSITIAKRLATALGESIENVFFSKMSYMVDRSSKITE